MKILNLVQNAPEWDAFRRTHCGASNCAAILGKSKYKTPQDVWEEMVYGKKIPINEAMQRGMDLEQEARDWLSNEHQTKYESKVGISDDYPWIMASFDCYDGKNTAEIKCPGEKTFNRVENRDIPEDYLWQMQQHLCVSGLSGEFFLAYMGPHRRVLHWIERNEDMIKELVEGTKRFYEKNILEFLAPEPIRIDAPFVSASEAWREANELLKSAQAKEKEAKEALIKIADGNCKGNLVSVVRREREGNVDYSKIPELNGIDLNKFRKEKIEYWEVRSL